MTSQPTKRVRRRQFTTALQDQAPGAKPAQPLTSTPASRAAARRANMQHREHHITTDYRYIRKDLWTILGVSVLVTAFIVGMSFVV